jgi:hypothetical protein
VDVDPPGPEPEKGGVDGFLEELDLGRPGGATPGKRHGERSVIGKKFAGDRGVFEGVGEVVVVENEDEGGDDGPLGQSVLNFEVGGEPVFHRDCRPAVTEEVHEPVEHLSNHSEVISEFEKSPLAPRGVKSLFDIVGELKGVRGGVFVVDADLPVPVSLFNNFDDKLLGGVALPEAVLMGGDESAGFDEPAETGRDEVFEELAGD